MSTANRSGLRVVLDTNVYVSAFTHPQGVPFKVWEKAVKHDYRLLVSPHIMRELANVLRNRVNWREAEILVQLKLVAKSAHVVSPHIEVHAILEDETDNRILECAVAGKADLIVSGDRHLTKLKVFQGVAIVRPIDFFRTLGG
jgi:putative PIN family toxin of toxin-antitoxin system